MIDDVAGTSRDDSTTAGARSNRSADSGIVDGRSPRTVVSIIDGMVAPGGLVSQRIRCECGADSNPAGFYRRSACLNPRAALNTRGDANQALQLNWWRVPESPCHSRSFGSDHRLPLLLANSMLAS